MASEKQKKAAKKNIKKARDKWQSMSSKARSRAQPKGSARAKPGSKKSTGKYYHVVVRPKEQFSSFRTHDVGREGHSQRVAGHRKSGSWDTQKWLISKDDAHVEGSYLVANNPKVKKIFSQLGSKPKVVKGDIFSAKPLQNVAEKDKPTPAQKKARKENIKKAQKARSKSGLTTMGWLVVAAALLFFIFAFVVISDGNLSQLNSNNSNLSSSIISDLNPDHVIRINDIGFQPSIIEINKGSTVLWFNDDSSLHTITGFGIDEQVEPGDFYSYTFEGVGTFYYGCTIHDEMDGTITVTNSQGGFLDEA